MGIGRFALRRLVLLVPVLLATATLTFTATRLVPADPASVLVAEGATTEEYQRIRHELGLDRPLPLQWLRYIGDVARGNLGVSIRLRRPVNRDLWGFFVASMELGIVAFALAVAVGLPLGIVSAAQPDRWLDHVVRVVSLGGVAAPIFWIGLVLQLLFYGQLGWLPGGGRVSEILLISSPVNSVTGFLVIDAALASNWVVLRDALVHLLLPAVVLAWPVVALISRMTRSAMLEVLSQDYIRTARAYGVYERRVLARHALKNAAPTILTVLGLAFGALLQGSVLVETVFNWPGLGLYMFGGIRSLDYPVVIGVALVISVVYVVINLLVDIGYLLVDPRLRYG